MTHLYVESKQNEGCISQRADQGRNCACPVASTDQEEGSKLYVTWSSPNTWKINYTGQNSGREDSSISPCHIFFPPNLPPPPLKYPKSQVDGNCESKCTDFTVFCVNVCRGKTIYKISQGKVQNLQFSFVFSSSALCFIKQPWAPKVSQWVLEHF